ncbi:MAG: methylmalonyl-CoA mutase [candidate division Zixibacteria bacterium]|nr:methylmalonyl-CoA mutase [candidate division Zixibacteria bacterium]
MSDSNSKKKRTTTSGIEIKKIYTGEDTSSIARNLPGEYPFTRGVYPTMYRGRLWTMRQYAGYATAEESNRRYRYLLEKGQTGLSVAFDLPTQIGYNSDHSIAKGEVGKTGVAIDSVDDMIKLFDGIPLDQVSTSMTINSTAAVLLAMYVVTGEEQGVDPEKLAGTVQNDILKEYIARGTYIYPPRPSLKLVVDIFEYCRDNIPKYNSISISGYHIREAGSTAVQEIAFTISDAICYIQAAVDRGMDIDSFASRLSFFFNAHNNLFEEVAKFRAARRIYAKILKERFKAKNEKSMMLRFHTQTAGSTLTAQQPMVNIPRVTLQGLSAVLGGTQSLHTNSFDEALALPSEQAATVALRTQQVIAHESGVTDTVDPLAGSYFVEHLTDKIEELALEYINKIDDMGGALKAIETGFYMDEIHQAAYDHQKRVESGETKVVGVNCFETEDPPYTDMLSVDDAIREGQIEKLNKLYHSRDNDKCKETLDNLAESAKGDNNLMYPIIECVRARATIGEICDVLRKTWGEYQGGTL